MAGEYLGANFRDSFFLEERQEPPLHLISESGGQERVSQRAYAAIEWVGGVPPPRQDEFPTRTQELDAEFEQQQATEIKNGIRDAIAPIVQAQLFRLYKRGIVQEPEPLLIPKSKKYEQLINRLQEGGYVSSDTSAGVELDLIGRIVAGLLASPDVPANAKIHLTGLHKDLARQVVEEEIAGYKVNFGLS